MAIIKPAARLVWFFGVTFDPGLAAQMSRESNIGRSMLQGMGAEEFRRLSGGEARNLYPGPRAVRPITPQCPDDDLNDAMLP